MTLTKPKHIFIVEDNEIYSMMLDYILSKDSIYQFVHFISGEECLANLHLNPDIIILDYGLPGMNGYETLLEIKKYNSNIHVVFLSNNEDEKLKRKLLKAEADYYVLKQGHGEKEIVDKIDTILTDEEIKKESSSVISSKSLITKVVFILLIIIIAVALFLKK